MSPHNSKKSQSKIFATKPKLFPLLISFLLTPAILGTKSVKASTVGVELNRGLEIGWYSMRVQNPFGTNYTGLIGIKNYRTESQEFVFTNPQGQDVPIKASDISFIYFRQLPDRSDVNVKLGDVRNIQITPYRQFLYDIPPGRLVIQDGILMLDRRWRVGDQKPFGVDTTPPPADQGQLEQVELTRSIQVNYLGNRYLVETELVNMLTRTRKDPAGGTVPRPVPNMFPNPAPSINP